jgi:hypothetical protein
MPIVRILVTASVASVLVACQQSPPSSPRVNYTPSISCTASVNSSVGQYNRDFVATDIAYRVPAHTLAGVQPSNFYVYCSNDVLGSEIAVFMPYPPRAGTTNFSPDSGAAFAGSMVFGYSAWYITTGAGASGSVTLTSYDSTTCAMSGRFSFTSNLQGATPGAPDQITTSGSFTNALHER